MNHSVITHTGIVKTSSKDVVEVCIVAKSGCSSCNVKGVCNLSETEEKIIKVYTSSANFQVGEEITVIMKQNQGFYALFLAYLLPFIILFITLLISLSYTTELNAGLISLAILIPYYTVIYLYKNKIQKSISYELEKL